jgi:type II secretory pathway pseudopilin PulG
MTTRLLSSRAGFTYIGALVMVVIMGIMLSQGALYWSTRMQQEREDELLYKGVQIQEAMRKWYGFKLPPPAGTPPPPATPPAKARGSLPDLEALVVDPSSASKEHLIRPSVLKVRDPVTNKESEWVLWKNVATGRNEGVFLKSESIPRKQANFPYDLEPQDFEGKAKYSEWIFIFDHYAKPEVKGGVKGLKGVSPLGTGAGGSGGTGGVGGSSGGTSGSP